MVFQQILLCIGINGKRLMARTKRGTAKKDLAPDKLVQVEREQLGYDNSELNTANENLGSFHCQAAFRLICL